MKDPHDRFMLAVYILALMALSSCGHAQRNWTKTGVSIGSLILSGAADGLTETISYHWGKAPKFALNNPQYWNPQISWRNKWKDGTSDIERFLGSSTVFVWTTDGYHLTRTANRTFFVVGLTVNFSDKRKHWTHYLIEAGASLMVRAVGFHLTYR